MKKGDKSGQFYLISAIVIIAMIIGFATMSNYLKKKNFVRIHDLGEELEIESEKIFDYYTLHPTFDLEGELSDFIKSYSNYAGIENLYFIFGGQTGVVVMGYQESKTKTILITADFGENSLTIIKDTVAHQPYPLPGEDVKITIDENEYDFQLKPGENFYFIISQEVEGEKYVVTN